jgi:hypothetical protein
MQFLAIFHSLNCLPIATGRAVLRRNRFQDAAVMPTRRKATTTEPLPISMRRYGCNRSLHLASRSLLHPLLLQSLRLMTVALHL